MKKLFAMFLLAAILVPSVAFADPSPWTEKSTWKEKAVGKLDFGVKNFLGGWTELFTEPHSYWKEDRKFGHTLKGIGVGIYHAAAFTIGGVLHLGTFPITNLDVPLPHGGLQLS